MSEFEIRKGGRVYRVSARVTEDDIKRARDAGDFQRAEMLNEHRKSREEHLAIYQKHAAPLLALLASHGFKVNQISDLYHQKLDYRPVIPALLDYLPKSKYLLLAEDIVRTLSVPAERTRIMPALIQFFRHPPQVEDPMRPQSRVGGGATEHLRDVIGIVIGNIAKKQDLKDLLLLANDAQYGRARCGLIDAIGRFKDPEAVATLRHLLNDESYEIVTFAVRAIGRQRAVQCRPLLEKILDHENEQVRRDTKKVLKKFDKMAS